MIVTSSPHQCLILMSPSSFFAGFGINHMSSPTPEPVARTSSYGTPSEDDDERLPPRPVAHGAAVAADAASPQEHTLLVKRTLRVSHSSSATSAPPARRGNGKRQKTTAAREDLCCFCLVAGSCTSRNCPCTKAGRPCLSCDPGECSRCTNMVEALNRVIREENYRQTSGIAARFRQRVGRALAPPLPSSELTTLSRTTTMRTNWRGAKTTTPLDTQYCPSTIRSTSALRGRCCRPLSTQTRTTTRMMHHPLLLASQPMGAMQQRRQPLLLTVRSMGATPPRHHLLLSACRPMGAICRRKEMPWTLVPLATKWVPLAMAPRLPLAYLLCDNQLFFQFSDKELRELGSRRRRLPRYETRRAFPPGLEGEWGGLRMRTVP